MKKFLKKLFYYCFYIFLASWLMLILFPSKFINKKRKFEKGTLMISNHQHMFDIMVHYIHFPVWPIAIAKHELRQMHISPFLDAFNVLTVKRGSPELSVVKKCVDGLKKGQRVLMFPEGTRNKINDGEIKQLKGGAALFAIKAKAPITPVLIHHKIRLFRPNFLYMGETFSLDEFYDKKPTAEIIAKASEVISERMKAEKEKMDAILEQRYGKRKWFKKMMQSRKQAELLELELKNRAEQEQRESEAEAARLIEQNKLDCAQNDADKKQDHIESQDFDKKDGNL